MKLNSISNNQQYWSFQGIIVPEKEHQEIHKKILDSVIENGDEDKFVELYKKFRELPMPDRKYHFEESCCYENKPVIGLFDTIGIKNMEPGCQIYNVCTKSHDLNYGKSAIALLQEVVEKPGWLLFKMKSLNDIKSKEIQKRKDKQIEALQNRLDKLV